MGQLRIRAIPYSIMFHWGILCYLIGTTHSYVQHAVYHPVHTPAEPVQYRYVNSGAHMGYVYGPGEGQALVTGNYAAHIPSHQPNYVPAMSYQVPGHAYASPASLQPSSHYSPRQTISLTMVLLTSYNLLKVFTMVEQVYLTKKLNIRAWSWFSSKNHLPV